MSAFQYTPEILERFPNVIGGVILGRGLQNGPTAGALQQEYIAEQEAVKQRIGNTPLSQIPSLVAWREAFRGFGVDPTRYRSASESLLRRLTKKGDIPTINTLVDIGNLISIRYGLPVAVIDPGRLEGAITVRFANGEECYTLLNNESEDRPQEGEVVFVDEQNVVVARRWCWRQGDQSAAQPDTTDVIITIEGHHCEARTDIEAALQDLQALLTKYAGGTYRSSIVDNAHPSTTSEKEISSTEVAN